MLQESLFARVPSCVLTSATLTVAESFGYIRTRLGFNEGQELSLSTEFNVRKQALLYIPKGMPDYRHPSYLDRAADEIRSDSSSLARPGVRSFHELSSDGNDVRTPRE